MEFPFDVQSLLPQPITRLVGSKLADLSGRRSHGNHFADMVDKMGVASAKAQGLRAPITTYQKLVASNHILYIMTDSGGQRSSVVGILKMGCKRLFLSDGVGLVHEVEPLCVLDFYVHESRQRSGCGKRLFEEMLQAEGVKPYEVAIDRPSPKFLGFLKKHYQLVSFVKQANNFVVFDQFFSTCKELGRQAHRYSFPSAHPPSGRRRSIGRPDQLSHFSPKSVPMAIDSRLDKSAPMPIKTSTSNTKLNTSADFSWSLDKTPSRTLNSNLSPHPRENEFNIITGRRKKDCFLGNSHFVSSEKPARDRVYNGDDRDIVKKVKVHPQNDHHLISNKAPHLNMRQSGKTRSGGPWSINNDNLYRSSSIGHVTTNIGHVTAGMGHVKYSRHVGDSLPPLTKETSSLSEGSVTRYRTRKEKHRHF